MEKLFSACVWGVSSLPTTVLNPLFSEPFSPEIRSPLKAGCLAGLVRSTWVLLSFWLWTLTCPQEDISWLLIHAGGLTIQAKPSARICQSGKWQLDLFHKWDTTSVLEIGGVSSVPPFQPFPGGDLLVSAAGGEHTVFGFSCFYSHLPLACGGENAKNIG